MKNQFSTRLFGYKKTEVDRYLDDVKKDYENELFKKRERLAELNEENRILKKELLEKSQLIEELKEQEAYVSKALVKAEQNAQLIIEEGRQRIKQETYAMKLEQEKWKARMKQARSDVLNFDNEIVNLLEKFRSEINYIMGKEISDILLEDLEDKEIDSMDDTEVNDLIFDSSNLESESEDTKKVIA